MVYSKMELSRDFQKVYRPGCRAIFRDLRSIPDILKRFLNIALHPVSWLINFFKILAKLHSKHESLPSRPLAPVPPLAFLDQAAGQ